MKPGLLKRPDAEIFAGPCLEPTALVLSFAQAAKRYKERFLKR